MIASPEPEARMLVILRSGRSRTPDRFLVVHLSAEEVEALLPRADRLTNFPLEPSESRVDSLARRIVDLLDDSDDEPPPAAVAGRSQRKDRFLHDAQLFIEENLHDPQLSPTQIAAAVHVSPRYLHAIFKEFGISVSTYVRSRRLEVSRDALSQPGLAEVHIAEIARRVGFADPSHFARVFRAAYGQTPREFRTAPAPPTQPPATEKAPS